MKWITRRLVKVDRVARPGRIRKFIRAAYFTCAPDFSHIIASGCHFGALICSWCKNQSAHEHKAKEGSSAPRPCSYNDLCLEVERRVKTK
jgi:hypothetical protein